MGADELQSAIHQCALESGQANKARSSQIKEKRDPKVSLSHDYYFNRLEASVDTE